MINTKELKKVLNKGIELTQFALLSYLYGSVDISELLTVDKIVAVLNLLSKRGLVLVQGVQYSLSQKGKELYEELKSDEPVVEKKFDTLSYEQIHQSLLDKLKDLTGKSQVTGYIQGGGVKFMITNPKDFRVRMEKFVKEYKIEDLNKVQQCLLLYIEEAYKTKHWFPIIKYYISREETGSRLADDYYSYEELVQVEEKKEVINTRELF